MSSWGGLIVAGGTWAGTDQRLVCYDKAAELKEGTDVRTRVELQLRGKKLLEHYGLRPGEKLRVANLTIARSYQVLRSFLLRFPRVPVAPDYSADAHLAFSIYRNERAPDGRHLLDWRTAVMAPDAARKLRRKIEKMSLTYSEFDWATFLPENPNGRQIVALTDWSPRRREHQ